MNSSRKCPACGAELVQGAIDCDYCGSRVVPVALSFSEREEVKRLAGRLNASLEDERSRLVKKLDMAAGFTMLLGLLILLLLGFYYRLISNIWQYMLVFSLIILFFRVGLKRVILINQAIKVFQREIEPQINSFLEQKRLPRWQFDQMASYTLEDGSPLKDFLFEKPSNGK